jgi:hypothetical protein
MLASEVRIGRADGVIRVLAGSLQFGSSLPSPDSTAEAAFLHQECAIYTRLVIFPGSFVTVCVSARARLRRRPHQ